MLADEPPPKVLLVEGLDDERVVEHLCRKHQGVPSFEILNKEGFSSLKSAIGPELKVHGRTAIGILVDADRHPVRRWEEIKYQLQQVSVNPPRELARAGTLIGNSPRVGIWLMPDNHSAGQIEDFIQSLIPEGDAIWPRAKCYIDNIPEAERKFSPVKIQRARIHAWLAACREPRKMGSAIGVGDLDADSRTAMRFLDWLRQLFQ